MRVAAAILVLLGLGFFGGGIYRELRDDPPQPGLAVLNYDLESALLGRTVREVAVVPPEPRAPGLVVLLDEQPPSPQLLASLTDLRGRAPVVLLPGGTAAEAPAGRHASHVVVEAIPDALERFGLEERVVVGGAGAAALARLDPPRFCAASPSPDVRPLAESLRSCN